MSIIFEQVPNTFIGQGDRTIETFPSGLIRVDQTFIGKTTLEATHRASVAIGKAFPGSGALGWSPAIDGVSIFPQPKEKRLPGGFTEYAISGYGRVNKTGYSTSNTSRTFERFYYLNDQLGYPTSTLFFRTFKVYDQITTRVIFEDGGDDSDIDFVGLGDFELVAGPDVIPPFYSAAFNVNAKIFDRQRVNYGKFSEIKTLVGYA